MISSHESSAVKPFKQVRGPKRKELKKLLKYRTARIFHLKANENVTRELETDGNIQDTRRLTVLHNIKSEQRCESRLRLNSMDIKDIVQFWMKQHELADPAVREFSLPFADHNIYGGTSSSSCLWRLALLYGGTIKRFYRNDG